MAAATFLATRLRFTAFFTAFLPAALRTAFLTAALRTAFFTAAFFTAFLATALRTAFLATFLPAALRTAFFTAFLPAALRTAFLATFLPAALRTAFLATFFAAFLAAGFFLAAFFMAMVWLLVSCVTVVQLGLSGLTTAQFKTCRGRTRDQTPVRQAHQGECLAPSSQAGSPAPDGLARFHARRRVTGRFRSHHKQKPDPLWANRAGCGHSFASR